MVDLVVKVEEEEKEKKEAADVNGDEDVDVDASGKRCTLDVWEHFTRRKVNGKPKTQCHHCGKLYLGDPKQGTSHLCGHLGRCPRLKFKNIRDMQQQVLIKQQNKVDGVMSINPYRYDQVKVGRNLACMVILHEYPLSMVEHIEFREFMSSLQPLFKVVLKNTLKSDILKIYDNEREKALKMMDKNGSRIAITTEMWLNVKHFILVCHLIMIGR